MILDILSVISWHLQSIPRKNHLTLVSLLLLCLRHLVHHYRAMMMRNNCPKLSQLLDEDFNPDLENILDKLIHDLKNCQHALFEFLEEKRCQFPRLYFLGDESLLDILGHTNEPDLMHPHIKYIFQAIYSLVLDEKKTEIIAFESSYSERVLLKSVSMSLIVDFSLFWWLFLIFLAPS